MKKSWLKLSLVLCLAGLSSGITANAGGYIYATAQGDSESLRVSMEKAKYLAEADLEQQSEQSGKRFFLYRVEVVHQSVKPVDGKFFHTEILLRLAVAN
ncbi:MAG: hypothetical protein HO273_00535 [Ferrovum myxofaciens]|uniref:hypothetical protein n=1 Tax=Ferrovum myxofaciens TaxID=416213 RepID=UPI001AF44901|nr:hypothetical protein [Ferrovum myxofaciens]QKE37400.1 MAG: hypothetical protein HO273_00535 [Ferrovum myxofaciens]